MQQYWETGSDSRLVNRGTEREGARDKRGGERGTREGAGDIVNVSDLGLRSISLRMSNA